MYVKLQSGMFEGLTTDSKLEEGQMPARLEKRCLLVYPGVFQSMDGEVEITDEKLQKLASNHNSTLKSLARMAEGAGLPMKACPPIQLDHSTSAKDTVGRLIGDLEVAPHTLDDGSQVSALFGRALILGKDNVEKVMDGRWTHLSIGADLEEGKLSELTITPFPAAAQASLLSKMASDQKIEHKGYSVYVRKTSNGFVIIDLDGQKVGSVKSIDEAKKWLKNEVDSGRIQDIELATEPKKVSLSARYDANDGCWIPCVDGKDLDYKSPSLEEAYKIAKKHCPDTSRLSTEPTEQAGEAKLASYKGTSYEVIEADGPGYRAVYKGTDDDVIPDGHYMSTSEAHREVKKYLDEMAKDNLKKLASPKWIEEHTGGKKVDYKGFEIHIAKRVKDNTYSWAILGSIGEDGNGYKSEADAVKDAKGYIDSEEASLKSSSEDKDKLSNTNFATVEKRGKDADILYDPPKGYFVRWKDGSKEGPFKTQDAAEAHVADSEKHLSKEETKMASVFIGTGKSGTKYYFEDGKIYDEDGEHVGKAPNVNAAKTFIDDEVSNLSSTQPSPKEGGDPMKTGFKKHLSEVEKMTDEELEAACTDMKKHLMDAVEMSEEDADKHLAEADEATCKKLMEEKKDRDAKMAAEKEESDKLAAEEDEKEKKLADEKKAEMSGMKDKLVKLRSGLVQSKANIALAQKRATIKQRLSSLRKDAKITPAEIKKIDIADLASKSDEAVNVALSLYSKREPQVLVGLYGSANATEIAKVAEDRQKRMKMAALEIDSRKNMGRAIPEELKRLAETGEETETETNIHIDTTPHTHVDMEDADFDELKKLIGEGKDDDAKKVMKRMVDKAMKLKSSVEGTEASDELAAVAEEIKQMSAQVEEAVRLATVLTE
jgi:hypothetical protein